MILGFKQLFSSGEPTKFREKIFEGKKIHSIRSGERWREGVVVHMAYGVRTKSYEMFKLTECTGVQKIIIHPKGDLIMVDGNGLNLYTKQMLAENDGFENYEAFQKWFEGGLTGQIIHWTDYRY